MSSFGNTQGALWYRNPPMSVQPEDTRPFSFSQSPNRRGLYLEDTGDLPQQTASAGNITCDLSSKISIGGVQNNQQYNFDVQSNNTSFAFNNQNINNFTVIPPAIQDAIYNNTTTEQIFNYYFSGSGGASGSVTSLSSVNWDNTLMELTFTSKTTNFSNGLVTSITNNANVVKTLTKLKDLSDWYDSGSTTTPLSLVSNVGITSTNLTKTLRNVVLSHGLITSNGTATTTDYAPLTDCPP